MLTERGDLPARILSLLLIVLLLVPPALGDVTFKMTHTDNSAGWMDPATGKARRDTHQAVFDYLNRVLDENGRARMWGHTFVLRLRRVR